MQREMSRRDVILASTLLVGGVCGCRTTNGPMAPQSTCCATPDLEPASLTVEHNRLVIDLRKAPSLREAGNAWEYCKVGETCFALRGGAWTRCPTYRSRQGTMTGNLLIETVEPRLQECDPNPKYPPYPWDDDRGFRCIRRPGPAAE
jgi:hypothetical protein